MSNTEDMAVFVRVVELANLSAAGRGLRLSAAVVSNRIARLERRLGVRLLNRTTRRVNTTPEGAIYYEHCVRILTDIERAESAVAAQRRPEDLLDHNCLLLRFPGSQQFQWNLRGPDGPIALPVSGNMDSDNGEVLRDWCLAGQGLALKSLWEVGEDLKAGRLRVVLPDHPPLGHAIYALYPHSQYLPPRVRVFIDFLARTYGPKPYWEKGLGGILAG